MIDEDDREAQREISRLEAVLADSHAEISRIHKDLEYYRAMLRKSEADLTRLQEHILESLGDKP